MRRHPFIIFMVIVGGIVLALLAFIQSPRFASLIKGFVAEQMPQDFGVDGDFKEFEVKLFPPGIAIRDPHITLKKNNLLNLPEGSAVKAERIDLIFYPLQILTGKIRVSEAVIVGGDIDLIIDPKKLDDKPTKAAKPLSIPWDQLFQVRTESIGMDNSRVRVKVLDPKIELSLYAKRLRIGQWVGRGGIGYELDLDVEQIQADFPKGWTIPDRVDKVQADAQVNRAGVRFERIFIGMSGISLDAKGDIQGNVLDPASKLVTTSEWKLSGDIDRIGKILPDLKLPKRLGGNLEFAGKVHGDLKVFPRNFGADGRVILKRFAYENWEADSIDVEGSWTPSENISGAGVIRLKSAVISSEEQERINGKRQASGGKIQIHPTMIDLSMNEPIQAVVELTRAHTHWLAGSPGFHGLDARWSGKMEFDFNPDRASKIWSLMAKVDLSAPSLVYDNQRMGQTKSYNAAVRVKEPRIFGSLSVDSNGIDVNGFTVALPHSKFEAIGKVDFKQGVDIRLNGPVDMDDVLLIAGNPIGGKGDLKTHVQVHEGKLLLEFQPQLAGARYLNLDLGDLTGIVRLDDDRSVVEFKDIAIKRKRTRYGGGGVIDIGRDTIDMNFQVYEGNINDFIGVFQVMTSKLNWFPESLTGEFTSTIRVAGDLDFDRLSATGIIQGHDWDFQGERLSEVNFRGGYDRGKYFIESGKAIKGKGRIFADISFDSKPEVVAWSLRTESLGINDFDHVARSDVPIRGEIQVASSGSGRVSAIKSQTRFELDRLNIRAVGYPRSELLLETENGGTKVDSKIFGGQVGLQLSLSDREENRIEGDFKNFDFTPFMFLLNSELQGDGEAMGRVSTKFVLRYPSGKFTRANGQIEIRDYIVRKQGIELKLENPARASISNGDFDLGPMVLRSGQESLRAEFSSRYGKFSGDIDGEVDLGIVEFFSGEFGNTKGEVDLSLKLSGTLETPSISGRASIDEGSFRVNSLDTLVENVRGSFQLKDKKLTVQNIRGNVSGGVISMNGALTFLNPPYPDVNLAFLVNSSRLKVYPFQYVKVDGELKITGPKKPYLVEGEIETDQALSRESFFGGAASARALKTARFEPPPTSLSEGDIPLLRLNFRVLAEKGVMIRNELIDAELAGDVRVVNSTEAPRIVGNARLLRGKLTFKGQDFQIQNASAEFDNPAVLNPKFDLSASTQVSGKTIKLYAVGRKDNWKIDLSSSPPMPESDILQLLAIGLTPTDMQRLRAGDQSVLQQGEAASLVLHSTGFNQEVKEQTGFDIQLDEAVDTQSGSSIFQRPSDATTSGASPKIVIKRQINKKLDVSVGTTVGVGSNTQRSVNAELKVTPAVSVIGVWNTFEGVNTKDNSQTSYGVDVKVQKRFK